MNDPVLGVTIEELTGCGDIYVTYTADGRVFIRGGKGGGCMRCIMEIVGRLSTVAVRHGTPIEEIAHTLQGVRCHQHNLAIGRRSCPDAVAEALHAAQRPK